MLCLSITTFYVVLPEFTHLGCWQWRVQTFPITTLPSQWRHNERDDVSNNRRLDCLFHRLFRRRLEKTPKLLVTGLCQGNQPVTGGFPHRGPVTRKMFPFDDDIMPKHYFVRGCSCEKQLITIFQDLIQQFLTHCRLMMTSSNGNIFRVTGHLCGKFTGPRWISRTKASDAELWCFLWFTPE